jgi:hypothetical protein
MDLEVIPFEFYSIKFVHFVLVLVLQSFDFLQVVGDVLVFFCDLVF